MSTDTASHDVHDVEKTANKENGHHDGHEHIPTDAHSKDVALAALRRVKSADAAHPMHWGLLKKWSIITVYCLLQVFVTLTSTSYISAEFLIEEKFNVDDTQLVTLGQSLFIIGTAVGPAFLGPLSYVT
jgi:hypothetical protein